MEVITLLNLFILPCIVAILLFGVILNLKYREKNVYQGYLISMLLFWAAVMSFVYVKFHIDGMNSISYNRDVISVPVLLLGFPSFISLISYPVVILNARLLKAWQWVKLLLPMLVVCTLYIVWHAITGEDPMRVYPTYSDLFHDIYTTTVLLRLLLVATYILYVVFVLRSIKQLIPIYNDYVHNNIADSDYNVDWVRRLVKYISYLVACYLLLLFSNSRIVNMVYLLSVLTLYCYVVEMSLFHKISEDIMPLDIRWSKAKGWYVVERGRVRKLTRDFEKKGQQIDHWMEKEMLYVKVDFTINDILTEFPEMTHLELTTLLRLRGETFQSYVRKYRINKACEIMEQQSDSVYPKQLYDRVGFSHYSSFSRSFIAVVGKSPSDYLKDILNK